jgi:hypothetical protein
MQIIISSLSVSVSLSHTHTSLSLDSLKTLVILYLFSEERKFSNYLLTLCVFVVFVFRRLALRTSVIIYLLLSSFLFPSVVYWYSIQ